jgi:hypothetical protein
MRLAGTAAAAGMVSVALAGTSLASSVSIGTTGPDSDNTVKVENTSSLNLSNTNIVKVDNTNVQEASTGDVTANKNTTVGGLGSGNASNVNGTSTSVTINNPSGGLEVGGVGGSGSGTPPAGGKGGSVMGASTGGQGAAAPAVLPEVGAKFPVDVSALRNAWHPQTAAPTAALADQAAGLRVALLALAVLMTMIGVVGSFVYARRPIRS